MPPYTTFVCILWLPAQFQLTVLCKLTLDSHGTVQNVYPTPTANMDPDEPNAESRVATARLARSEIMRAGVPLEVATGPTCTPQWVCPIRARFTFKCATSGRGGTLLSCKYFCDSEKHGGWAGHRAKMAEYLTYTGPVKGGNYLNDQRESAGWVEEEDIRLLLENLTTAKEAAHVCIRCLGTLDGGACC